MILRVSDEECARFGASEALRRAYAFRPTPGRGPGGRRARGGGGGAPAVYDPATDAALFAWYRQTTVDAGSGACSEWTDLGPVGDKDLVQGSASARPTISSSDSDFNSLPSLSFDGGDRLSDASGSDTSHWTFMHDTSDVTLWCVFYAASTNGILFGTSNIVATVHGFVIRYDAASEELDIFFANGSGTYVVNTSLAGVAASTTHAMSFRKGASGWEMNLDGAPLGSGGYTGTPSSTAPPGKFTAGAAPNATGPYTGKQAEIGIVKAYRDLANVDAYLLGRY